jgi:hypothetical protein
MAGYNNKRHNRLDFRKSQEMSGKFKIGFLSSDLVGTWRFNHLRHRSFKFNATRIVLYLIPENGDYRSQSGRTLASPIDGNPSTNKTTNKGRRRVKKETAKQFLYVFGNLLSQGQIEILHQF